MWTLDRVRLDRSDRKEQLGVSVTRAGFDALRFTNPASTFQFFGLAQLPDIISQALQAKIAVLHPVPEPLSAALVAKDLRERDAWDSAAGIHIEDVRTRHGALFGRTDSYIASAGSVLANLRTFIGSGG